MSNFAITADIREKGIKLSTLRKDKQVPAVVYGKTQEPISLSIDASDFLRLYRNAGESSIIDLSAGKKKLEVVIHQTQKDPVIGNFTHVDFYAITRGEALQTKIALTHIGESNAVKEGAILEESLKEIEVKCLPRNLVDHFNVDISVLENAGDVIRVSDLGLDTEKYELITPIDDVIASATLPRAAVASEDEWEETGEGSVETEGSEENTDA